MIRKLNDEEALRLVRLLESDAPDSSFPVTAALEFPLGEFASIDGKVRMILGFCHADGLIQFPLPITGKEQFTAQGLEGKARLTATGKRALSVYAILPKNRRALYVGVQS